MVKLDEKVLSADRMLTSGESSSLLDLADQALVVFFYPRANTPGCSRESQDFSELYQSFKALGCEVVGASADSLKKQQNFKAKFDMPFELIADEDESLGQAFGVIQEKKMYGKTFMGIVRSTFVLNAQGEVVAEWRKVKVPGHAEAVLEAVKNL